LRDERLTLGRAVAGADGDPQRDVGRVAIALQPLARDRERGDGGIGVVEDRAAAAAVEREAQDRRCPGAGEGHAADGCGGRAVVDRDHREAAVRPTVHDGGEPGRRDSVDDRVVVGRGPDHETVDDGVGHAIDVRVLPGDRDQREPHRGGRTHLGDAREEPRRLRIFERVGQRLAEHDAEAAGPAPAQRSRPRVRARVAELGRRGAHLRRAGLGHAVRARVGVRDRHDRHAGGARDVGHRGAI
jgi:hypothetical protein